MSANPSIKNGFFPIANELAEALARSSISGSEVRILWVVFRKTWGWSDGKKRKDFDKISLSQFVTATEMKHTNVAKALKSLVVNRLLVKNDKGYGINQDYSQWVVAKRLPRNGSSLQTQSSSLETTKSSSLETTKSSSQLHIYKRNKEKKETIQKKGEITPSKSAKDFFKGVLDLIEKVESDESAQTRLFLQSLEQRYTGANKSVIWSEIKKFTMYWTELNQSGTKERWQKQDAFQIDRRLTTWFGKIDQFKSSQINNKETKVGKL